MFLLGRFSRRWPCRAHSTASSAVSYHGRYLTSPKQRDLREAIQQAGVPVLIVEAGAHELGWRATNDSLAAFLLIGQGAEAKPPTRFVVVPADRDCRARNRG